MFGLFILKLSYLKFSCKIQWDSTFVFFVCVYSFIYSFNFRKRYFNMQYPEALSAWKVFKYGVFSSLNFPAFGLSSERYGVFRRIWSECGKMRTRKNSVFGHFSRRGCWELKQNNQKRRHNRTYFINIKFWAPFICLKIWFVTESQLVKFKRQWSSKILKDTGQNASSGEEGEAMLF